MSQEMLRNVGRDPRIILHLSNPYLILQYILAHGHYSGNFRNIQDLQAAGGLDLSVSRGV